MEAYILPQRQQRVEKEARQTKNGVELFFFFLTKGIGITTVTQNPNQKASVDARGMSKDNAKGGPS